MARTKQTARRTFPGMMAVKRGGAQAAGQKKTKRRARSGVAAVRQIRKLQSTTKLILPKSTFQKWIREICQDFMTDLRFTADTFTVLQEAGENYLVDLFAQAQKIATHAKRATVQPEDLHLARDIKYDQQFAATPYYYR